MIDIVKRIILEAGLDVHQINNEIEYYSNKDIAYFFVLDLELSEIADIKNYSDFERNEKYTSLKLHFIEQITKGESNTLEKNTALIILVKCDTLTSIVKYQQQILLLEEDEYFFKKYVILYSELAIQGQYSDDQIIPVLQKKVKDEGRFNTYATDGYTDKIAEYLVVIQLFVKLPFLKLSFDGENYKLLEQKISEALGMDLERTYNKLHQNIKIIQDTNFIKLEDEDSIDELLKLIIND